MINNTFYCYTKNQFLYYARNQYYFSSKIFIAEMLDEKIINIYDPITGKIIPDVNSKELYPYVKLYGNISPANIYSNISSTNLKELIIPKFSMLPQKGAFIGYKIVTSYDAIKEFDKKYKQYTDSSTSVYSIPPSYSFIASNYDALAMLYIPEDAERVDFNPTDKPHLRKYRTNKAKVLQIKDINTNQNCKHAVSLRDRNFIYTQGKFVHASIDYNGEICGSGIHFFMTPQEAIYYGLDN